jgi:hypothetical protein
MSVQSRAALRCNRGRPRRRNDARYRANSLFSVSARVAPLPNLRRAPWCPPHPNSLHRLLLREMLPGMPRETRGEGVKGARSSHATSSPARGWSKVPRLRRWLHICPGERIWRRVFLRFRRSMQMLGHPLSQKGNSGLRLRRHLQLRTVGRVDRVRRDRGEERMNTWPNAKYAER